MAGIGALVWAHLGAGGQVWALGAAIAVPAVAGALIALPALRLSGVYLALGTAAFAVVLDRWIFTMPSFRLFGVRIAFFDQGSLPVSPPRLFGFALDSGARLIVFAAACLGLASIGVAALRRGRLGRRLIALRDSEAAYATLGGNILVAKVLVFGVSAGIAGLGGALYGMQQQTVTAEQFSFVAGLPIFLVAVVGGLGLVGTGLFAGAAFVGPVNALVQAAPWTQNAVALLPGLAGLALGRGEGVVGELRRGWAPIARHRLALFGLLGGLAAAWLLRLGHVISGPVFFCGTIILALVLRGYATSRTAGPASPQAASPRPEVPVEWWGLRRPWRAEDGEVLDRGVAGG
jgi:branched-chain amino acid transport system permease protein